MKNRKMFQLAALILTIQMVVIIALPMDFAANNTAVDLKSLTSFAVLSDSAVELFGENTINGDVGVSKDANSKVLTTGVKGDLHVHDAVSSQAVRDLISVYDDLKSRDTEISATGNLGEMTFTPGVYNTSESILISDNVTLDAKNNPDAVFIFKVGFKLSSTANSHVLLVNGAKASNVFWVVGANVELADNSTFAGTIISLHGIQTNYNTRVDGRLLSFDDTITVRNSVINNPDKDLVKEPEFILTGKINVVARVFNDNGGTLKPTDVKIRLLNQEGKETTVVPTGELDEHGINYVLPIGTYKVVIDGLSNYKTYYSGDGGTEGTVKILAGEEKSVVATIEDQPVNTEQPIAKSSLNMSDSINAVANYKVISINKKVAKVEGIFTVTNTGKNPLEAVVVSDSKFGRAVYVSGDLNKNGKLDLKEKWLYKLSLKVVTPVNTTVKASAKADGVVVSHAIANYFTLDNLRAGYGINVKTAAHLNPASTASANVDYTYTVKNTGKAAIKKLILTDTLKNKIIYVSGDLNHNNIFDPGEIWIFHASSTIKSKTTWAATVKGMSGSTILVSDTDFATATIK